MYSAVKMNGKKLYELARRGEIVERSPRKVTISKLELVGEDKCDYILDIHCSKGTYIRTLCSDIGDKLGCGGCMSSLRRVKAGVFSITQAHTMEQIQAAADLGGLDGIIIPVDTLFTDKPNLTVNEFEEKKLRNGNTIKTKSADGTYRVYSESGEFLLLAEVKDNLLRTIKSFFEV